jgi:hypothetical protein
MAKSRVPDRLFTKVSQAAFLPLAAFFLIAVTFTLSAQTAKPWYADMPQKAAMSEDGKTMRIGGKNYPVHNAFDPIAPKGGARVIDFAETLDYYLWIHKKPDGNFTASRIDFDMNIFYYDDQTQRYTAPNGEPLTTIP